MCTRSNEELENLPRRVFYFLSLSYDTENNCIEIFSSPSYLSFKSCLCIKVPEDQTCTRVTRAGVCRWSVLTSRRTSTGLCTTGYPSVGTGWFWCPHNNGILYQEPGTISPSAWRMSPSSGVRPRSLPRTPTIPYCDKGKWSKWT